MIKIFTWQKKFKLFFNVFLMNNLMVGFSRSNLIFCITWYKGKCGIYISGKYFYVYNECNDVFTSENYYYYYYFKRSVMQGSLTEGDLHPINRERERENSIKQKFIGPQGQ